MPISTDSDAWQQGDNVDPIRTQVLEFLKSNPTQAYHEWEIADAIIHTNWEVAIETDRLMNELSEEEFNRRQRNDELPNSDIPPFENPRETIRLSGPLDALLIEGKIEVRRVEASVIDWPYDWDEISVYSYSG